MQESIMRHGLCQLARPTVSGCLDAMKLSLLSQFSAPQKNRNPNIYQFSTL